MNGSNLATLVRSYLDDDEVRLLPDDPDGEHRLNTWGYSILDGGADVVAVVAALEFVSCELRQRTAGSGTFYAWYDEQAGQLRCSLTSAPADRLPFRAPYRASTDAAEVVALVAADSTPGLVTWNELGTVERTAASLATEEELPPPFPVWVAPLR
ncbi:hypothetical protein [Micromonospora cremea]|uniref:Uncharacterized protein n=1 Tax=Micromonospora cremea TaxID=709881 RepID=A0A1N6A2X1_9ACTN|nr:hypothetical protein [Micromonospora cremea]SIN28401.1 hypothetical protein SAMN04489832_4836 [Micromonospora cremea]